MHAGSMEKWEDAVVPSLADIGTHERFIGLNATGSETLTLPHEFLSSESTQQR